jgi:pentapeptide MXKDX repeat protein
MKRNVMAGLLMTCMSAAVLAQSAGTMDKGKASGSMKKMTDETTYTGCLEKGSAARTFVLTHANRVDSMPHDAMQHDSMKNESTKTGSMKDDAMKDDAMKKDATAHETMSHDMMTATVNLTGSAIDLNKHVGHKVTVSGLADAMAKDVTMTSPAVTVKALKMVAKSCS